MQKITGFKPILHVTAEGMVTGNIKQALEDFEARRSVIYLKDLKEQHHTDLKFAKQCKAVVPKPPKETGPMFTTRVPKKEEIKRLNLYNQGMSDRQIAKALKMSISGIIRWRETRGLEPHPVQGVG